MKSLRFALLVALVACVTTAAYAGEIRNIPADQLGIRYQLISKLHVPMGQIVRAEGVVVEGPFKGYEGGPNLRVQSINGEATQEDIQIVLQPYFLDWGRKTEDGLDLPELEMGATYEMEGYTTGDYAGIPGEAYEKAGVLLQTSGYYFRQVLVVYRARRIEPLVSAPWQFRGKSALLQGTARSEGKQALLQGDGWTVVVDTESAWPEDIEGKQIETYGMYNPTTQEKRFALLDGTWRLVRLEDQVGREVELRGQARSLNNIWWFHYRGIDLYVENMSQLPGWPRFHYHPMIIRGALERAMLPRIDQIGKKADRDLAEQFIVRNASWEPLDELLGPERPFPKVD